MAWHTNHRWNLYVSKQLQVCNVVLCCLWLECQYAKCWSMRTNIAVIPAETEGVWSGVWKLLRHYSDVAINNSVEIYKSAPSNKTNEHVTFKHQLIRGLLKKPGSNVPHPSTCPLNHLPKTDWMLFSRPPLWWCVARFEQSIWKDSISQCPDCDVGLVLMVVKIYHANLLFWFSSWCTQCV